MTDFRKGDNILGYDPYLGEFEGIVLRNPEFVGRSMHVRVRIKVPGHWMNGRTMQVPVEKLAKVEGTND